MSYADDFDYRYSVAGASVDQRLDFIRRTYLHLTGAIVAYMILSVLLYQTGVGFLILRFGGVGWLVVLGAFMLVGWLATAMAHSNASTGVQYAGLAIYTAAEALVFTPLIALASLIAPNAITQAAIITLLVFSGLSLYVITSRRDFSFLRTALVVGGMVAVGLIIAGAIFGFSLGLWFSVAMVVFACGAILYSTSNVLHHYNTDQHVAASLELFAAVALLFWYVLRILLVLASSRD